MTLSAMSIWLGVALALTHGVALLNPSLARQWIRSFPRSRIAAWILTAVDVAWVAFLLYDANIELIHRVRWIIPYLAPVAYVMIIFCMNELLAPRALGGLLSEELDVARQLVQRLCVARLGLLPRQRPALSYMYPARPTCGARDPHGDGQGGGGSGSARGCWP